MGIFLFLMNYESYTGISITVKIFVSLQIHGIFNDLTCRTWEEIMNKLKLFCALFLCAFLVSFIACAENDDDDDTKSSDDDSADDDATDDDVSDDDDDNTTDDDDTTTGPTVTETSPADGDDELKLATVVIVTFSEEMDQASVESAFALDDGTKTAVAGTFAWNTAGDELAFTPDSNLTEDTAYTISIGTGAKSLSGDPLESAFSATFNTVNLWTRTFNGSSNGVDTGKGVATDDQGNIYVAGYYYSTTQEDNIWTRKYDKDGDDLWTHMDNGSANGVDWAASIDLDSSGNVYITGRLEILAAGWDLILRQLDKDTGNENWTYNFNPPAAHAYGYGVSTTYDGTAYIAGESNQDIWVGKILTSSQSKDWSYPITSPGNFSDAGKAVVADSSGNAYFTGFYCIDELDRDIWIRKYNSAGTDQWTVIHDTGSNGIDEGHGIALDSQGNVYVCGFSSIGKAWLGKFSNAGSLLWSKSHTTTGSAYGVATDQSDNIFVTGYEYISGQSDNFWLRKYDTDGNSIWTQSHNGTANGSDKGYGVTVDNAGNIIVTGYEFVSGEEKNIWVRKYDPDGNWAD